MLKVLECVWLVIQVCGSYENGCRDTCGLVATGVAVPPLLLDDDSLIVAGVIRWLRNFLIVFSLPLRVSRDAHARRIGLCARTDVWHKPDFEQVLFKLLKWHHSVSRTCFYLHRVDNDGERGVVPLAAALLRATPGTFTTAMDGANSKHTEDHHDNQEPHTHHYDDCGCSWHHCKRKHHDDYDIK